MGKPTGFMEYQRKTGNTVAPLERIKNFKEFHLQLPQSWFPPGRTVHRMPYSGQPASAVPFSGAADEIP